MSSLVGVGEASRLLGISPCRVRNLDDRGILPALPRVSRDAKRRWHRQDVLALVGRVPPLKSRGPLLMRVWARVEPQPRGGCWVFTGALNSGGYGQISVGGDTDRVGLATHRVMYEEIRGPIPSGLHLDHLCRNRACCNPWHLEPVTCAENIRRGVGISVRNARKTECVNGHPFTPANTYRDAKGRHCRPCHAQRERDRRARLRAVA